MNTKGLHKRLTDPIESFAGLGDTTDTLHGPLTYIDRGGDVLAVAHLDTVDRCMFNLKPVITKQYQNYRIDSCPQLDDRLGAWMVLDVLPRAGIKCDVLLTDSEEIGESTAQYFKPPKQYNWMMQFDRAGSDVVMYNYEDDELESLMKAYEYSVGYGSFTDICYLEEHNCKGFNFGVGYHNQHTDQCYANLSETWNSFRKVQSFYNDYKDTHFEHEKVEPKPIIGYVSTPYTWTNRQYTPCRQAKAVPQAPLSTSPDLWDQFSPSVSDHSELRQEFDSDEEMYYELDVVSMDMFGKDYYLLEAYQQQIVDDNILSYWED